MNALTNAFCCVFLALIFTPASAQEGKVVVAGSDSKELKRTSYRMRIPVERLKNAREALEAATDLAKRVRPIRVTPFSQLGNQWIMLHRVKAESSIKGLVSELRSAAQEAKGPRDYNDATSAARALLTDLAQLDPEQALELVRRWPEPSKSLGPSAQNVRSEMESQFCREIVPRIGYSNPEAALKLWSDAENTGTTSYGLRAEIAESLVRMGRKDQGLQIIGQTIAELGAGNLDLSAVDQYLNFVQSVARIAPDRFLDAFKLLIKSAAAMPDGGAPSVKVGEQVLTLDNAEALTLAMLTGLSDRPGVVARTLDALPGLKSKLDTVGGIDSVLAGGPVEISYLNQAGLQTTTAVGHDFNDPRLGLYAELRGKAAKNPGLVRDRLSETGAAPDQIGSLLNLAFTSSFEDPDLASIALETARKLITRLEPIGQRASMFAQMLRISRQCDGEVDPELLEQGFLLVAELREEEKDQGGRPGCNHVRSDSDQLERALISELAIDNFEAAIRYVRTMPDEQARLSTLIDLVQSCRRWF